MNKTMWKRKKYKDPTHAEIIEMSKKFKPVVQWPGIDSSMIVAIQPLLIREGSYKIRYKEVKLDD